MPLNWFNGTVTLSDPSSNVLASIHAPKIIQANFLGSKILDASVPQELTWVYDDSKTGQVAFTSDTTIQKSDEPRRSLQNYI